MRQTIRLFLLLEGASFIIAGLVHFGVLVDGYEHQQAAIAESSIGVVLLVGLGLTYVWPARTRIFTVGWRVTASSSRRSRSLLVDISR